MKPDWKDAPEWAQWLGLESDGTWYWHEMKPELEIDGKFGLWGSDGKFKEAELDVSGWQTSLEPRPAPVQP